jgi:hypothetical protein
MKPRDFTDFHEMKAKKFLCQSCVIVWLKFAFRGKILFGFIHLDFGY